MKSIKYFKYKNTFEFEHFLSKYGYIVSDVVGFSVVGIEYHHGNILKEYMIYISGRVHVFFKVVYFKDFNECNKARLGVINNKLLVEWYSSAAVRQYKVKDVWGMKDEYVIEC